MQKLMRITLRDLKFLLECEERAQASAKVGYVGANKTAKELLHALNSKTMVSIEAIEGALYSFELLQKEGYAIKHPDGLTKEKWAKRMCPSYLTYDEELGIYHKK
jgi:hypothetical protein